MIDALAVLSLVAGSVSGLVWLHAVAGLIIDAVGE